MMILFLFSVARCLHLSVATELMNNEGLDVNGWGFLFRRSAVAGVSWNTPRIFYLSLADAFQLKWLVRAVSAGFRDIMTVVTSHILI